MDQTSCPKGLSLQDKASVMAANETPVFRTNAMFMALADELGYIPTGEELYQECLMRFNIDLKVVARSWGDNPDLALSSKHQ